MAPARADWLDLMDLVGPKASGGQCLNDNLAFLNRNTMHSIASNDALERIRFIGARERSDACAPFDAVDHHFLRRGRGIEFDMEAAWIVRRLRSATGRVLDIGCGIGALVPHIGEDRFIGVDYRPDGLSHTRRQFGRARLCAARADQLPFADASIGAVTAQHLIEHVPAPAEAVREWARVLAPGGVMLVLTPNRRFRDPTVFDDPTHVTLFDGPELARLLIGQGLKITDHRTLGLPWFRHGSSVAGGWRLRRTVIRRAPALSMIPTLRWHGQTLCCVARKPVSDTGV